VTPWIFLSVTFLIISSAYYYVGWRIIVPASLNSPWNWIGWLVLIMSLLFLYVPFILTYLRFNDPIIDTLAWLGYISLGFFSLVIAILLLKDVFIFGSFLINKLSSLFISQSDANEIYDPERRRFLINAFNFGTLAVSAAATSFGIYGALRKPYIKKVTVPLSYLPEEFEGFTIAQFSDIHVGPTVKREYLQTVVNEINKLKADLIAFTGDLVDGSVSYLKNDVEPCKDLKAPYGKFFVTGNHEYG